MLADNGNVRLTEDMIKELFQYAFDVVTNHTYMDDINKLHEEDRYYNWYHGFTKIKRPWTDSDILNYNIDTSATSGVITTQYYGEKFQPHLVERNIYYGIIVYPPESLRNSINVTLHFKLEKVSLTGMSSGVEDISIMNHGTLNAALTSASFNFSTRYLNFVWFRLSRKWVSENDISKLEMDFMPGFRLSWYYTGMDSEVSPDSRFNNTESLSFRRQVSLITRLAEK